jgi:hypothetical protein
MLRVSLFLTLLMLTPLTQAATFVVDRTDDVMLSGCTAAAGDCSLTGAIGRANFDIATDNIHFNVPMSDPGCVAATGVCTFTIINSSGRLIEQKLIVDGYTQPGASANTQPPAQGGSNAQIKIQLRGNGTAGLGDALTATETVVIRGLAIGGFSGNGAIGIGLTRASLSVVEGNFLGTDATGMIAVPNSFGVNVAGNPFAGSQPFDVRIGGLLPAQRNVISGNTGPGITGNGTRMLIQGNLIGTNAEGTGALSNKDGITIAGCGNDSGFDAEIGGNSAAARNVISANGGAAIQIGNNCGLTAGARIQGNFIGVDVAGLVKPSMANGGNLAVSAIFIGGNGSNTRPHRIGGIGTGEANLIAGNFRSAIKVSSNNETVVRGNRIFRHSAELGIEQPKNVGRDPNDPGDADDLSQSGGLGSLQNFPEISAFAVNGNTLNLSYRVDSATANQRYPLDIDFYLADGDEGAVYLGSDSYTAAQAQTVKAIALTLPNGVSTGPDDVIVATAHDLGNSGSEFSFAQVQSLQFLSTPNSALLGLPYPVAVRVQSSNTPFKPNGIVRVSDGRGGSCAITLVPTATANRSEGSCQMISTGTAGSVQLEARYSTFEAAFAQANGNSLSPVTSPKISLTPAPEKVSFDRCTQFANERDGQVQISVLRQGSADVGVRFELVPGVGTAITNVDFTPPADAVFTWLGSDSAPRVITVALINDAAIEVDETFRYRLVNASGTTVDPIALMEVRIVDDDRNPDLIMSAGFEFDCPF